MLGGLYMIVVYVLVFNNYFVNYLKSWIRWMWLLYVFKMIKDFLKDEFYINSMIISKGNVVFEK